MRAIDARYGIYQARIEEHTTVTPDGLLRNVRTVNKSYGPNDHTKERVEVRQGRLTPQQMADLASLFADWDTLSGERYRGVPDGAAIELRYGDKTVSGGSETPRQVWEVNRRLDELATPLPVVTP